MSKPSFIRLPVPSFDLAWLRFEDKSFVLIPGGGGSTQSGVKNQIQIAKLGEESKFEFVQSYKTDTAENTNLCSGVYVGVLQNHTVVTALLGASCRILRVEADSSSVRLVKVAEFVADKAAVEPSVNCSVIISEGGKIVTGGEDGVCKVWNVTIRKPEKDSSDWDICPAGDLSGHKGPVMALSSHPTEPWVCTASKDGTCKIWDVNSKKLLVDVPFVDGLAGVGSTDSEPVATECRGCCFSPEGNHLYTIRSAKRGPTALFKWEIIRGDTKGAVVAKPLRYITAGKFPSTKMCISDCGSYLALGVNDGSVSIFETKCLDRVSRYECHYLPVTGLGFSPAPAAEAEAGKRRKGVGEPFLVSCSADNAMATMQLRTAVSLMTIAWLLLILFLVLVAINLFLFKR